MNIENIKLDRCDRSARFTVDSIKGIEDIGDKISKNVDGYTFYYCKTNVDGVYTFGCYDENGKWWSSRASVINRVFDTNLLYSIVNHYACYAVDVDVAEKWFNEHDIKVVRKCSKSADGEDKEVWLENISED